MKQRFEILTSTKLVGCKSLTNLTKNNTSEIWKKFLPLKNKIKQTIGQNLFSVRVYEPTYFTNFNLNNSFEKWAAIEVSEFEDVPNDLECLVISEGLYAVFYYVGIHTDHRVFDYIYGKWLPQSKYTLDHRPHFEILGKKNKNNDPASEEEIWIPIKNK